MNKAIIEGLKKFDTTSVSDALDRLGIVGGLHGIRPVIEETTFCGTAFTVHYVPCGVVKGTVGDFLDDVEPGQVVVLDNGGRTYCTVWGDLMTINASQRGIAGTVIDGVCRDVPGIRKLKYPIFTKGCYMVTGKDRVQCDDINTPVAISGVLVKPGDVVMGDESGALVIPAERAEEVYRVAEEIVKKEEIIEREVRKGVSLRDARASMGYHALQTRK